MINEEEWVGEVRRREPKEKKNPRHLNSPFPPSEAFKYVCRQVMGQQTTIKKEKKSAAL